VSFKIKKTRVLFPVLWVLFFAQISVAQNEPETVPEFSLARYMGTWYQIAFIPNRFQAFCVSEPSAEYSLLSPGRISIINACRDRDGVLRVAEGQGRLNKKYFDPARLQVRFAPAWLGFLSAVWGDYWVLDIDSDYSVVLVGSPDRQYLWVLARDKSISKEIYKNLLQVAQKRGFNPNLMVVGEGSVN